MVQPDNSPCKPVLITYHWVLSLYDVVQHIVDGSPRASRMQPQWTGFEIEVRDMRVRVRECDLQSGARRRSYGRLFE
jgi:hypothetical protein